MRKSMMTLIGVAVSVATLPAKAEYLFGFGNMYLDYQAWNHGFGNDNDNFGNDIEDRNQAVLGIEGGAVFDWGQVYGFYDYEGVDRAGDDRGASLKGTIHYNLAESGASLYAQVYNTDADKNGFHEQNRVLGLGYTALKGDNWAFTPFLGFHHINQSSNGSSNSGNNGGMFGYSGFYNTTIANQNITFSTWNELEFARNDKYSDAQSKTFGSKDSSESWGLNGSLNAMWHVTEDWSTGVLYRYTVNKLARKDYQDLIIYRVQYSF